MPRRTALLALLVLGACAGISPPPVSPPALVVQDVTTTRPIWPYWQPVEVAQTEAHATPKAAEALPDDEPAWLNADPAWRNDSASVLAKVRETGAVTRRTGTRERGVGAFYVDRLRRGAPVVVTMGALFAVAHLGFSRASAEVETRVMRPAVLTILHRLDTRLAAEAKGARPDLAEGYRIARTTVAVALRLVEPRYVVPPELDDVAAQEVALVRGHSMRAPSPLLGTWVDYGVMAPRGPIDGVDDPRIPFFETAEWLAEAPLAFAGKAEANGAPVDVGAARAEARAALLVARLIGGSLADPVLASKFGQMNLIDHFVLGDAEDLSPLDVAELARRAKLDLGGGRDIADAAKLDRLRHIVAPRTMRLAPFRASPEGKEFRKERKMPTSAEVVTWLGALGEGETSHASFYASLEECMASYLRPSGSDPRRSMTVLAAWTLLRHDALAFAHDAPPAGVGGIGPVALPTPAGPARQVTIEPRPDPIAKLLGAMRQLRVGLVELGGIEAGGPSATLLTEIEAVLTAALEESLREARGDSEPMPGLLDLPERIARLESWLGPSADPVVIDVDFDAASGHVLEEGTGPLEEIFTRVRDDKSHREVLAVGARIPQLERHESEGRRLDDATWRAWIEQGLVFAGDELH
jgi:hypothetical protein